MTIKIYTLVFNRPKHLRKLKDLTTLTTFAMQYQVVGVEPTYDVCVVWWNEWWVESSRQHTQKAQSELQLKV